MLTGSQFALCPALNEPPAAILTTSCCNQNCQLPKAITSAGTLDDFPKLQQLVYKIAQCVALLWA